jgi:uncharacterized protein (TIGR03067 family)
MFGRARFPIIVVLFIAATAPAQDAKKELDKLQGEWFLVSEESKGLTTPEEIVKGYKVTIKGDQLTSENLDGKVTKWTFKIDPSKEPKHIDMTTKFKDKDVRSKGIYKLEGDTLSLCRTFGVRERPTEFKTTAESGNFQVFKRIKK